MNIYQLSVRYQQLLDQEEFTPEEMEELESLHGSVEDSCVYRAKYIKNLEAEAAAVLAEVKNMKERADNLNAEVEKRKERLIKYMHDNSMEVVKSPFFNIKVSQNRPSVEVYDEDAIPEYCWRVQEKIIRSVDKLHIKDVIESGTEVPGCRLIAKTKIDFK